MYRIIGTDGKQYGPVAPEQLRRWIAEGRANAQTLANMEGSAEWRPLAAFPEFSPLWAGGTVPGLAPPPPIPPITPPFRKTNSFAITGLILGVFSLSFCLCCYGLPFNVAGLVFSILGLMQIRSQPHLYEGQGLAIAGIILSALSILWALGLLAFWGVHATWYRFPHRIYRL